MGGTTYPRAQSCSLLGHSLQRVSGGLLVTPTTIYFPLYQRLSGRVAYGPPSTQTSDTTGGPASAGPVFKAEPQGCPLCW